MGVSPILVSFHLGILMPTCFSRFFRSAIRPLFQAFGGRSLRFSWTHLFCFLNAAIDKSKNKYPHAMQFVDPLYLEKCVFYFKIPFSSCLIVFCHFLGANFANCRAESMSPHHSTDCFSKEEPSFFDFPMLIFTLKATRIVVVSWCPKQELPDSLSHPSFSAIGLSLHWIASPAFGGWRAQKLSPPNLNPRFLQYE